MLRDKLEGWGEREAQEGGDVCILTADSSCCTPETNNTESNHPPTKNKIKLLYTD